MRKWIKIFITTFLSLLICIVVLNYVVNPYYTFGIKSIKGFNDIKNNVPSDNFSKKYVIKDIKPDIFLIGTSCTGSLDPSMLAKYGKPYNFAFNGSSVHSHWLAFNHIVNEYNPKTIIYGVDQYSFGYNDQFNSSGVLERYTKKYYFSDYRDSLISLSALKASFLTIKNSYFEVNKNNDFDKTGRDIYWHIIPQIKEIGLQAVINEAQRNIETVKFFEKNKVKSLKEDISYLDKNMDYIHKMVQISKQRGINFKIFFVPRSFFEFQAKSIRGNFEMYFDLKKKLSKLSDFYDFTGKNSVTTNLNYYYDTAHLRPEYSELIFSKIFKDISFSQIEDFGKLVTIENVDDHIAEQKKIKVAKSYDDLLIELNNINMEDKK